MLTQLNMFRDQTQKKFLFLCHIAEEEKEERRRDHL